MKVLGIVVEFNPMHNGHHYFIEKAKEIINPDVTIAIMSSSFSMRGDVMVVDKWSRAKFALDYGIDIVLELPYLATVNSSDYFSHNAINSLNEFGITDLAFGVELDNLEKLIQIKNILKSESFDKIIKMHLDKGHSYANSSYNAIKELTRDEEILKMYGLPNNTLALGYLKAIDEVNPNINVTPIKRIANNYYDETINESLINSATALRNEIALGNEISKYTRVNYEYFDPVSANANIFYLLRYQFITKPIENLINISGVNEGIENRFYSFIYQSKDYDDFVRNVQTRRYSRNRIKRIILNIILNINKSFENQFNYYLRILAMNQIGISYVNSLDKQIKKQIITSFKNINNEIVDIEIKVSKLYSLLVNKPELYTNEFKTPFIKES